MTRLEMQTWLASQGEPRFRGEQLFRWVHGRKATHLDQMSDLQRQLRQRLTEQVAVSEWTIDSEHVSADGTRKLRIRTHDQRLIESVLIPDTDAREEGAEDADQRRITQCISSQVGCAIDCDFCATAKLGFGRHLTAGEIVSQVYGADALLANLPEKDPTRVAGGIRLTNLVFMGMGEPLHNYDNVLRAIAILTDPLGRQFPRRRITVSTAGLVPGIERLAQESMRINLAVSLNATTDAQRDRIMPINRKYNLELLLGALRKFPLEKKQTITIEYVLLAGVNDALEDARRFPELLRGIPCKINLIPWNPHPGAPYQKPERKTVLAFQAELMRLGFLVYIRKTKGDDIDAACGQLAAAGDARAGRQRKLPVLQNTDGAFA